VQVVLDYAPRHQFRSFHDRLQRWAIIVAHRRAGKTVATINDVIRRAIKERKRDGRYAFVAPYYNQAKDIAWTYLKRYSEPILAETPREAELSVLLRNGARIRLYGADNPDRLRGIYLDGVALDEFPDMAPPLWINVLRPALSDRKGWAIFIGTPKGKNEFFRLWANALKDREWFALMLKASETGLIDAAELADARKQMGDDQYAQEYECSFEAAIRGAFYAEEMRIMLAERRLVPIQIDPDIRVHTSWDLGISDSTAIVFWQCVGRERRIVDYYETSGVGLDHYVQILTEKRLANRWRYGTHFFPHDIAVRELGTGESRKGTLERSGIEVETVPQCSVLDGINATRRMLGRTWIDPLRCERLIEALRQYRREYDDRLKDWKTNPLHDWTSHGADAVRTFAAGFDDPPATGSSDKRRRDRETEGVSSWAA
jgi:phage terminase large subunit